MPPIVSLQPSLTTSRSLAKFNDGPSALAVSLSPRANEVAVHTHLRGDPPKDLKTDLRLFPHQRTIWFANYDATRDSTHLLYREAYITFKTFQHHAAEQTANGVPVDGMQNVEFCHRFLEMYINNLSSHVDRLALEEPFDEKIYRHYESMSVSLNIFQAVFTPSRGIQRAIAGEELLDWLNSNFVAPTSEEGKALASLEKPWTDDNFWPYLNRCTLRGISAGALHFFRILTSHPSASLRHIAALIPNILTSQPRSTKFATEHEFFAAHRRWLDSVRKLRGEMRMLEDDDGQGEWREGLETFVGILEGNKDVIVGFCDQDAGGGGWREVIGVWGVWIDIELRRDDLADILGLVLETLPLDSTSPDEALHAAIVLGDVQRTIRLAADLDIWLGAHVADVLLKLGQDVYPPSRAGNGSVSDEGREDEDAVSSRDFLVMDFAGRLHSDPTLWAIELEYLASCGKPGRGRMGEIMRRLAVDVEDQPGILPPDLTKQLNGAMDRDGSGMFLDDKLEDEGDEIPAEKLGKLTGMQRVEKLVGICKEYEMWDELESLCRVVARILVRKRRYGDAVPYCLWGRDIKSLGSIADLLLEEYIAKGADEFIALVDELPTSATIQIQIHHLDSPLAGAASSAVFLTRMQFLTEYASFHQSFREGNRGAAARQLVSMLNSGMVPRWWWGVLLLDAGGMLEDEELWFSDQDAYDLLRYLEEIYIRAEQGCGSDYLGALEMMLKKNVTENEPQNAPVARQDSSASLQPKTGEVIKQLEVVRLALARYLARSFTSRSGKPY